MKVTFLGTGTSTGVPTLGCRCGVCNSQDPRNNRMRSSILVQEGNTRVVVDTGPEFRIQGLRCGLSGLEGVVVTHSHADHIHGLDDIRPLSYENSIPLYGSEKDLDSIRRLFPYFFKTPTPGTTVPRLTLHQAYPGRVFTLGDLNILPLEVYHGEWPILGYRFGPVAYVTDCSRIPEATWPLLEGLELLILGALRHRPHPTHFNVEQALEAAHRIGAKKTYFTHMNHELDHESFARSLPRGVEPAWDGLIWES